MKTYNELKKISENKELKLVTVKIAILGDTATQFLTKIMKGYGYELGYRAIIYDADYNSIEFQVLDGTSQLYKSTPDYIIIAMSAEKAYETFSNMKAADYACFSEQYINKICNYWNAIKKFSKAKIIQFNFNEINDEVFGNYAGKVKSSFLFQIRSLNVKLMEAAAKNNSVFLTDISSIQNTIGRENMYDPKYYYSSRISYSLDALPYIVKQIFDIIEALQGHIKKCLILDLDNTLWGGVVGDDGIDNIQIGELGIGRAFSDLQRWFRLLKERGILLTVCSKNNENMAKEPFIKHPDMVLRLEDISFFVANWEDKVNNIYKIRQTLNIGLDSMVFIDDNPFERNMVKKMIPEITVPDLPKDPAFYLEYLKSLNLFETTSYSSEDAQRTNQYKAELGRENLKKEFQSIDDYLISLEMSAEVKAFDPFQYPRIAQLSQRSNQFNLRTIRYTEEDIAKIAVTDKYIARYYTLKDKFGDHGLISVVILEKNGSSLFVNTWFMSCRVLKRGMEEFIINSIMGIAQAEGFKKVIGEYLKTPKNEMVEDIYLKMGFKKQKDNCFELETDCFLPIKTFIRGDYK